MSTGDVHVLDRHVLSSGPALVDSGKDTFAWTPGLAGERAGRLKNEVPWGVATAGAENPPRLEGREVLSPENYLRLHFAWLPLDGRMGFCVWGAIGDRPLGRSVWRVLTHTALMDAEAFEAVEANPFALLKRGVAGDWVRELAAPGSFDERGPVEPIRVVDSAESRAIAEELRRNDIVRLRGRLRELLGAGALERRLAALYAALSSSDHVALASTPDRQAEMLARLAWLTLPPADRWQTSFTTEQGASAGALPRLMALDLAEWHGRVPPETFLFQDAPPEGAAASKGQLTWAADVVQQESLLEHVLAHDFAAAENASLLKRPSLDQIDRYALHRVAVDELRTGSRGVAMLGRLADPQARGLLSPPLRAGMLMGLALRRSSQAPSAVADALQQVLERLPAKGRNDVARGMVRALALDDEAAVLAEADAAAAGERTLDARAASPGRRGELRAAALFRCGAVHMRLTSAGELARLLDGEPEGALLAFLWDSPEEGPAALIAAIFAADNGALLARLTPLLDMAMARLPKNQVGAVLDSLDFGSEPSAEVGIRVYEAAERERGYQPSVEVLQRLLHHVAHPVVRGYLASPRRLSTVFSPAFAAHAGTYIRAVRPDALALAGELVVVARRMALVPLAPPSRAGLPPFGEPASPGTVDDGVVADALKYLLAGNDTARVIDLWRAGPGELDSRLLLLSHPAWGASAVAERARAGAAMLVESALDAGAEAPAPSATALTTTLRQVVGSGATAFSVAEGRLVVAVVSLMAQLRLLRLPDAKVWETLPRRIAPSDASRLVVWLVKEQRGGQGDTQALELSYGLVNAVLQSGEAQGLFERLPPGEHQQYWIGTFNQLSSDFLARDEVLAVLAASLRGREGAQLAGMALTRVLNHVTSVSKTVLGAIDRLAWTEWVYLGRSAFDEDPHGNVGLRVRVIVRLLAHPATFPLSLHLAERLLSLVPLVDGGVWTDNVLQDNEIDPLKWTSPSSYERLHPRVKSRSVIFLPENFRIELPEPAATDEPEVETMASPRKSRKR